MNNNLYDINFRELYIFLNVVELGSFTKASVALAMTQSAVSKNIESLEKKLDLLLFTRNHKNLYITEAGNDFYNCVKKSLDTLSEEYNEIWSLQHRNQSLLRLGIVNNTDLELYFWPLWLQFKRRFPEVREEFDNQTIAVMLQQLISHKLDLIFVPDFLTERLDQLHLKWKWVARDYARIIVPKGHRLEKGSITFEALSAEPIVLLSDVATYNIKYMEKVFADHGCQLKLGKQYTIPENICRFYTGDDGILFTDVYFDCSKFHEKIVKRSFKGIETGIVVAWDPKCTNDYVSKFIKMINNI